MRFYLDEDLSPKIAALLRKDGIDAVSAHEIGMTQVTDLAQLDHAASENRVMVTRNRNDCIALTVRFFNENRPHGGVLIVPHTLPGDRFTAIAGLLQRYSNTHPYGLTPYTVDFLPSR